MRGQRLLFFETGQRVEPGERHQARERLQRLWWPVVHPRCVIGAKASGCYRPDGQPGLGLDRVNQCGGENVVHRDVVGRQEAPR